MKKEKEAKVFNICQQVNHPQTGANLINEAMIISGVCHKSIGQWAFILHDKDKNEDGTLKAPHYHIVLKTNTSLPISTIAKWFGVPENFVAVPRNWGAFMDCVQYLTHERHPDKYRYEDCEVKANFDFRARISAREARKANKNKDYYRKAVLSGEMTPWDCKADDPINYANDFEKLKKLYRDYLQTLPPPHIRINFYISGEGGFGKGLASRALARSLFPDRPDEEIFYEVAANNVSFEGYSGQPVIIWHDQRANELITKLGGRGNVFNVFDTFPSKSIQNVKYGSVNLINAVNIVNSVQPYREFLDGLAGEYVDREGRQMEAEDKNQSYRRFPFIIPLHEDDFDLLVNKGFFYGNGLFSEWEAYYHIRGSFKKVRAVLKGNEEAARAIDAQMMELPKAKYVEAVERHVQQKEDVNLEQALASMADFGTWEPPKPESAAEVDDDVPF